MGRSNEPYEALGWEAPKFAHLPLLLKPDGKGKLSKRAADKLKIPIFPLFWSDPVTKEESTGYKKIQTDWYSDKKSSKCT